MSPKITLLAFVLSIAVTFLHGDEEVFPSKKVSIAWLRECRESLEVFVERDEENASATESVSERIVLILYYYSLRFGWNEELESEIIKIQVASWKSGFTRVSIMGLPEGVRKSMIQEFLANVTKGMDYDSTMPLLEVLPMYTTEIIKNGGAPSKYRNYGLPRTEEATQYFREIEKLISEKENGGQ